MKAESRPYYILLLSGLLTFLFHCISVSYYPMCWNDEVEIIEIGRRALFQGDGWSVYLGSAPGGGYEFPSPLLHYVAAAIQELLCRVSGGFVLPRLFFMLSLPACALAMFKWLSLKRDIPINSSLFVSLLFLVDPNATICAHWYRPDLWAMTLAFVAMILVAKRRFAWAGAVSAFMVFFWITSALFLPLILLESIRNSDDLPKDFLRGIIGALAASVLVMIPLYSRFPEIIAQYIDHSEIGNSSMRGFTTVKCVDFLRIAIRSPFVWLLAAGGIVLRRRTAYAIVFVCLSVFMLWSRVYHLRMIYLMPYLFLFAAMMISRMNGVFLRLFRLSAVSVYVFISIFLLEVAALPTGNNSLSNLMAGLKEAVPVAKAKVYLVDNEHELYLACRKLGWKMFGSWSPDSAFEEQFVGELIREMDAVLVVDSQRFKPSEAQDKYLREHGFSKVTPLRFMRNATGVRKLLVDFFYTSGYPDVLVYSK